MAPASLVPRTLQKWNGVRGCAAVGGGHLLVERLEIEGGVAQADVGLAGDGAAVADHAIHADALAEPEGQRGLAQPHRQAVVGIGRLVQAVAFAEQPVVIGRRRLGLQPPMLPYFVVGAASHGRRRVARA